MRLPALTLNKLKEIISGDNEFCPYLTGNELVLLFSDFEPTNAGMNGVSRNSYALDCMKKLNGTENLKLLFERIFSQNHFISYRRDSKESINIEKAVDFFNRIVESDGYVLKLVDGVYKVLTNEEEQQEVKEITVDAYLRNIQPQIISQLELAKFLIWVAVAWFTDKKLFNKLIEKKQQGLVIQLIIDDDEINKKSGLEYKKHFQTCMLPPRGNYKNIMHHKFCIIDLKKVITGSYNWSEKAKYNDENIVIIDNSKKVEGFAEEFISLRKNCLLLNQKEEIKNPIRKQV